MVDTIYRSKEEWATRYAVPEYGKNAEITGDYDQNLAAKCENGTFVGLMTDDVKTWRGIPYSKQPVGEKRFMRAKAPESSDKVFEAYYYGHTAMQPLDDQEKAALYPQGEDCLNLNVWSSTADTNDKKPVFVFIHGGGWINGGTSDPLYEGSLLAHYNPELLVVTITYRVGMMGQINLSSFEGGEEYEFALNNGLLDQTQALKWIKNNIAAFGGDPENVTICGESAGGGSVSALCIMKDAKGLFKKAIPMSGSVNQANPIETTNMIPDAIRETFGCKSVDDIKAIPFDDLMKWWQNAGGSVLNHCVRDGEVLEKDPFECWRRGDTKDLVILQGHTANEFAYYLSVFGGNQEIFDAVCETRVEMSLEKGSEEYKAAFAEYKKALLDLGYVENEVARQYMNDVSLAFGNTYQAILHANNGGHGYCYTFTKGYDGDDKHLGAAHAVDCFYLFGNFDGNVGEGSNEEVDLSRKFQAMITNFCKTGDPSIEGYMWPEYNDDVRFKMMIDENMHVEANPEGARVDAELKMIETDDQFKYTGQFAILFGEIAERNPELVGRFMQEMAAKRESLEEK